MSTVVKVDFPVYAINSIADNQFVIAGGGGKSKTGIPNVLEIFSVTSVKDSSSQLNLRFDTDSICENRPAPMNLSVRCSSSGQVCLAFGTDEECAVVEWIRKPESCLELKHFLKADNSNQFQTCVSFSPDGKYLVTGSDGGLLKIWSTKNFSLLHTFKTGNEIEGLSISPNSKILVASCKSGKVFSYLFDNFKNDGEVFWTAVAERQNQYRSRCLQFSSQRTLPHFSFYSIYIPKTRSKKNPLPSCLVRFDSRLIADKKSLINESTSIPCSMDISDDGVFIGLGTLEGDIFIYIAFSLQKLRKFEKVHSGFITGLKFIPTSKRTQALLSGNDACVLSVSIDNKINLTSVPSRTMISIWLSIVLIVFSILIGFFFISVI